MRRPGPHALLLATCATASCAASTAVPAREPGPAIDAPATDYQTWGAETIALPPSFAPDMALVGEETLLFAPGMFKAEAADFFSYAFVLRVPGQASIATPQLVTLIEQYYRGLMTAVATDKKLDEHAAQAAQVTITEDSPSQIVLEVATFDAFVTRAPIRLHMKIERQAFGDGTCILAQVAPATASSEVWPQLAGAAQRLSCENQP